MAKFSNFQPKKGIISKVKDFFKSDSIKEADEIAEDYYKLIMAHWNKAQDLKKAFIVISDDYVTLTYRASTEFLDLPNTRGISKDYVDVKLLYIKKSLSECESDKTRARISASRIDDHKEKMLFGRDMGTNDIVVDKNGIVGDYYDYLNVTPKPVLELINFFIDEYRSRYPELKDEKYLNYMTLFRVDSNLQQEYKEMSEERRNNKNRNRIT